MNWFSKKKKKALEKKKLEEDRKISQEAAESALKEAEESLKKPTLKEGVEAYDKKVKTTKSRAEELLEEINKQSGGTNAKAKGGIVRKYKKGGLVSKRTFIARGCGKVMNKRRKKTKIY